MALVEFVYNGNKTLVQCKIDETMEEIIKSFLSKTEIKYENVYFLYDGKILTEENLSFNEIANELDKNRKQMNIVVNDKDVSPYNTFLKKSEYIICPECKELILISIKNHKICLSECKNGHKFEDIPFKDFEQTQYIDESKIKCDKCKRNKNEVYQNLLYICLTCKINLCPLCKSEHDKSHFIIDYEQKDFICHSHLDNYTFCCSDCKKDICALCEIEHKGHKIITYGSIISDKDDLVKNLNNSKKVIIEFKEHIDAIISKLNEVVQNIEDYFNAYSNIINNFNVRNKNYYILQNINYMKEYNKTFINNINDIINDKNIANSVNNIIEIFDKIKYKEPEQPVNNIIDNIKEKEKENIQIQEEEIKNKEEDEALDIDNSFIIGYNPFEDNYEILSIKKLKKLKSFGPEYKFDDYKILKDGRILFYHKNQINVYNINKDIVCDINCDNLDDDIKQIFQMNDENLIIFYDKMIEIYALKEKFLEKINTYNDVYNYQIFKLLDEKILVVGYKHAENNFSLYAYENKELKVYKKFTIDWNSVWEAFSINQNEILISYESVSGLFTEKKDCLAFYNIKKNKIEKTLKIGSSCAVSDDIILINNNLVARNFSKLLLIDINTKKIKYPVFEYEMAMSHFLLLNNKKFIITNSWFNGAWYYLCEIQSDEIKLIEEKKKIIYFKEYPENKLIRKEEDKTIVVYESE